MSWKKVPMSEFLKHRDLRFKPKDKQIIDLKRIEKIDFSGNIITSTKPSNTDMILVKNGDLVISGINVEKGAMAVYQGQEDLTATIHYSSYEFDKAKIDEEFLKSFLKSKEFTRAIKEQVPGGIKTEIKAKHLLPLKVQIPSNIEDQKRIVNALKKKNNKIEAIISQQSHQHYLLNKLRQQILQDAIQGKLVPQDPNDEPASVLLERIKAGKEELIRENKIKKEKSHPPIKPEEVPFEIPENWVWCRLGEVIELISGQDLKPNQYSDTEINGTPYITGASNLYEENVIINRWTKSPKSIAKDGDLLLTCKGSGVGKMAYLSEKSVHIARQIMAIRSHYIPIKYVKRVLEINVWAYKSKAKSLIPGIDRETVLNTYFPLPPNNEQFIIVNKIERLMTLCDKMEYTIKKNQKYTQELLQMALKEALENKR